MRITTVLFMLTALSPCFATEPDWDEGGELHITESITSAQDITLSRQLTLNVDAGHTVSLTGSVSGRQGGRRGLVKTGTGRLELWGNNRDLDNLTTLQEGTLHLAGRYALGDLWAELQAYPGTTISYAPDAVLASTLNTPSDISSAPDPGYDLETIHWRVDEGVAKHIGNVLSTIPLTKLGAGTLQLFGPASADTSHLTISEGAVQLGNQFSGHIVIGNAAFLTGDNRIGHLTVGSGGTLAPTGRFNIQHTMTFQPDSHLHVRAWADGQHDSVHVHGTADLDGHVLALPQGAAETWQNGIEYVIVSTDSGLGTSRFASVASALPYLEPSLSYDAQNVTLTLAPLDTRHDPAPDPKPDPAPDPAPDPKPGPKPKPKPDPKPKPKPQPKPAPKPAPQPKPEPTPIPEPQPALPAPSKPAAPVVPTKPQQDVTQKSEPEPEPKSEPEPDVPETEIQTPVRKQPLTTQHAGWAATVRNQLTDDSRFLRDAVYRHATGDHGFWSHAFHSSDKHTGTDDLWTARRRISGLLLGSSVDVSPRLRLGAFGGGSHTHARASGNHAPASRTDTVHAGLYSVFEGRRDTTFTVGAAHSWHRIRNQRPAHVAGLNDALNSHYGARTFQTFGGVSRPLWASAAHDSALASFADIAWVQTRQKAHTENGGPLALYVASARQSVLLTTLGLRASHRMTSGGIDARLTGTLGWRHAAGDTAMPVQHYFRDDITATPFTSDGLPIHRNMWQLRLGVQATLSKHASLGLEYAGQLNGRSKDHGVQAGLSIRW